MSDQTPYIPTTNDVREDYAAWEYSNLRRDEFDRWLNQVKRDAAREALDGLARKARWKVAEALENGSLSVPSLRVIYRSAEDYRDTHYPEVTP